MALEQDLELIDNYLSNKLSGVEKEAFEKRLQHDNALSSELKLQQELVEGIKHARMVELKSMLNSIPVTSIPPSQTSLLTKVGGWALVGGIVATATYFYFKSDEAKTVNTQQPVVQQEAETLSTPEPSKETTNPVVENATEEVDVKPEPKNESKRTKEVIPQVKPTIKAYDPSEEVSETDVQKYEQEQYEIISKAFITSSIEVDTNNSLKKYNFHYVFNSGRLVLYGAFEKNLYEILEFINQDKRTVVLYYKSNYYLLDINKTTPTLLTPIKNKQLLKKLHDYRGD